ncbi:MAG: histidine phosphatase family protein [Deltaproteobacteria bacterium]|jgi:broad specificity phosphatase PhoE|nr:MAG: histidine phosphatase family protein [Deltaproteobacteria bacterium]
MTTILLVRHGETDWNKQQVFRGRIDVPLNSVGLEQARATGEALSNYRIDAIYSSPLSRAMETANAIGRSRPCISIKEAEGFIDIDFGKWQGMPHDKVKEEYNELYNKWQREPHNVKMPDGESLDEVKLRSMGVLNDILARHENEIVAIASHRVVNKVILCAVLGLTNQHFWCIRQDTCAINIFDNSGRGFIVSVINDTCHIKALADSANRADF